MSAAWMARVSLCLFLSFSGRILASPSVETIMDRVVAKEDLNYERAKNWEYEQHFILQKVDGDGNVKEEKAKTVTYRPEGRLGFNVGGMKGEGKDTEVGIGLTNEKDSKDEGRFSESIKMRELRPFYTFTLAGEE